MKYLRIYSIHQHSFITILLFLLLSLLCLTNVYPGTRFLANDYNIFMNSAADSNYLLMSDDPNTSEWLICGTNSWEDLKTYLPEAKSAGLSISVVILPPYQSDPVCSEGSFSEPFEQDYILWAQEIARLSLRYSNLISYRIEDLQENLNLGYLTQNYIDSVIAAGCLINSRLQFITPHNIFYVDKAATGNGDGTTWNSAAISLAELNWQYIGKTPFDTVYISGGTNSKVYPPDSCYNKGNRDYLVVIAPGKDAGHDGDVIFHNPATGWTTKNFLFYLTGNIKLTGFTFISDAPFVQSGDESYPNIDIAASNISIDNCTITGNGRCVNILVEGNADFASITNNYITQPVNNSEYDQDGINIFGTKGGHTITGNTIIQRGLAGAEEGRHQDCIQLGSQMGGYNYLTTIAHNVLIFDAAGAWASDMIIIMGVYSNRFLIYNNIFYDNTARINSFSIYNSDDSTNISARIFNNTFIQNSLESFYMILGNIDTLEIKNNIIKCNNSEQQASLWFRTAINNIAYKTIDYNRYYKPAAYVNYLVSLDPDGISYNLTQWQALGYDAHSTFGMVNFVNEGDSTANSYKPINFYDNGIDLLPYFNTDIIGNIRPLGNSWDIGAIEQ